MIFLREMFETRQISPAVTLITRGISSIGAAMMQSSEKFWEKLNT
jgi:hypothetical protein